MLLTDLVIKQVASEFRGAIDAAGQGPWQIKGITFPAGACGHASELLGRYIIDHLGIVPDYVSAFASDEDVGWPGSHAWLEWGGLTIDITGDQFHWPPVIVTRRPKHHVFAEYADRHPIFLDHHRGWWARECGFLYKEILQHMPSKYLD